MHSINWLRTILRYESGSGKFFWLTNRRGQVIIGSEAGYKHSNGYWIIEVERVQYRRNILAWTFANDEWPSQRVDHKDRIKDNDRIDNLRLATASQNGANGDVYVSNKLGERGITAMGNRFRVCLYLHGKQHYAGCYGSLDEAIIVRNTLAKKLHGGFAPCK